MDWIKLDQSHTRTCIPDCGRLLIHIYIHTYTLYRSQNNLKVYEEQRNKSSVITENESLVRAMIENAKSSTTRENLENAAMAQKNFMLLPFDSSVEHERRDQKFLQKIARRGEEIRGTREDGRG